jgi:hypothetical protein
MLENNLIISQIIKNQITICIYPRQSKTSFQTKNLYTNIHGGTVHKSQDPNVPQVMNELRKWGKCIQWHVFKS